MAASVRGREAEAPQHLTVEDAIGSAYERNLAFATLGLRELGISSEGSASVAKQIARCATAYTDSLRDRLQPSILENIMSDAFGVEWLRRSGVHGLLSMYERKADMKKEAQGTKEKALYPWSICLEPLDELTLLPVAARKDFTALEACIRAALPKEEAGRLMEGLERLPMSTNGLERLLSYARGRSIRS